MGLAIGRYVAVGLASVGFILGLISIFVEWWGVDAEGSSDGITVKLEVFDARPYDAEFSEFFSQFPGVSTDVLETEALVAGLIVTGSLLALAGGVVALTIHIVMGRSPVWAQLLLWVGALGAGTSIVLAPLTWPDAFTEDLFEKDEETADMEASWYGSQASPDGEGKFTFHGGVGWYLAMAGLVLLPVAAAVTQLVSADPRRARQMDYAVEEPRVVSYGAAPSPYAPMPSPAYSAPAAAYPTSNWYAPAPRPVAPVPAPPFRPSAVIGKPKAAPVAAVKRYRCPRCSSVVEATGGVVPACPHCGYGSRRG